MKDLRDTRIKVIWVALLASYNTQRPKFQQIYLEDADPIWKERAENVLRDLDAITTNAK